MLREADSSGVSDEDSSGNLNGVSKKYLAHRFWYRVVVKIRKAQEAGGSSEQRARVGSQQLTVLTNPELSP